MLANKKLVAVIAASIVFISVGLLVMYTLLNKSISSQPTGAGADVVMIVEYSGGLCADGNTCSSTSNLYSDGAFDNHTPLSATEVTELKRLIEQTDFQAYLPNPSAQCASASDGQDLSLRFPSKYGDERFTPCKLTVPTDNTAIFNITDLIYRHQKN